VIELGAYLIPALDGVAYGLLLFITAAGLSLCFGTGNVLNLAHDPLQHSDPNPDHSRLTGTISP